MIARVVHIITKLELGGATVEVETTTAPPELTPQPAEQPATEPAAADTPAEADEKAE